MNSRVSQAKNAHTIFVVPHTTHTDQGDRYLHERRQCLNDFRSRWRQSSSWLFSVATGRTINRTTFAKALPGYITATDSASQQEHLFFYSVSVCCQPDKIVGSEVWLKVERLWGALEGPSSPPKRISIFNPPSSLFPFAFAQQHIYPTLPPLPIDCSVSTYS
jgi:hypothetical protein